MKTPADTDQKVPTTLSAVRDLATLPVWHPTKPSAADLLGVSRGTAYAMARSGDLPTLHLGNRVVVMVAPLLRMLGAEESA